MIIDPLNAWGQLSITPRALASKPRYPKADSPAFRFRSIRMVNVPVAAINETYTARLCQFSQILQFCYLKVIYQMGKI